MSHRGLILLVLLLCWQLSGSEAAAVLQAPAADSAPTAPALVLVSASDSTAIARFVRTGLPAYAHFYSANGGYLLTAADDAGRMALTDADLPARRLPARLTDGPFYLAYPAPGSASLAWERSGHPLFADGRVALLAASAQQAEALADLTVRDLPPDYVAEGLSQAVDWIVAHATHRPAADMQR